CGGAGATHVCGFAPYLQVDKVVVPTNSPIFGAYGASTVNCQQVWEKSRSMKIFQWDTQSYSQDFDSFNDLVNTLRDNAIQDLKLEGYEEDQIKLRLELDMRFGMQYNLTRIISPHINIKSDQDYKDICDKFTEQYAEIYTPEATFPMGGINVECFFLTAYVEITNQRIPQFDLGREKPSDEAMISTRQAYWSSDKDFVDTPVFAFSKLEAGNKIIGPALIEAEETTYVIEPEWQFSLDASHNTILDRI
ncbi:MAG: hypothetical protein GY860_08710, partial [Desulfobacteraceae bacterium]|nr:hypothetical protein [Desulfobacteraceae bacterium]